jgi:hypothetical protein
VLDRERHVRHAHVEEAARAFHGVGEGGGQQVEALDGDCGEHAGLVAEVVGRGGVGDAGPAREIAQADTSRTALGDDVDGGAQHTGILELAGAAGLLCARLPPGRPPGSRPCWSRCSRRTCTRRPQA